METLKIPYFVGKIYLPASRLQVLLAALFGVFEESCISKGFQGQERF